MSPPPGVGGGDTIAILTSCTASLENPGSGDTVILSAQVENVSAGDTRADLYVGFSFNDARTGKVRTKPEFVAAKGGSATFTRTVDAGGSYLPVGTNIVECYLIWFDNGKNHDMDRTGSGRCLPNATVNVMPTFPETVPPYAVALRRHRVWMSTDKAWDAYKRRKQLVEPVFGIIKGQLAARRFLLRGIVNVSAEWTLLGGPFAMNPAAYCSNRPSDVQSSSSASRCQGRLPLPRCPLVRRRTGSHLSRVRVAHYEAADAGVPVLGRPSPIASATASSQRRRTSHSPSRNWGTSISLVSDQQPSKMLLIVSSFTLGILIFPASAALYVGKGIFRPGCRISCRRPAVELINVAVAFASADDNPVTGIQPLPM